MRLLDRYARYLVRRLVIPDRPTSWPSRDPEPEGFIPFELEEDHGR